MDVESSVTRCKIKIVVQMFSKVAQIISTAVFTLIDSFQNSPKVTNLFGHLESEFVAQNFQKAPNLVALVEGEKERELEKLQKVGWPRRRRRRSQEIVCKQQRRKYDEKLAHIKHNHSLSLSLART